MITERIPWGKAAGARHHTEDSLTSQPLDFPVQSSVQCPVSSVQGSMALPLFPSTATTARYCYYCQVPGDGLQVCAKLLAPLQQLHDHRLQSRRQDRLEAGLLVNPGP